MLSVRRYTSLDGLRGFAALVVVFHHALLLSPNLAAAYRPGDRTEGWWGVALTYSPAHIVWAGQEAVYLFFVLSGFVLALPFLGERRASWRAYYPQRLVRLYLPVLGAVILSLILFAAASRTIDEPGMSWWLTSRPSAFSAAAAVNDAALWRPGAYNTALWSLRYEVIFSMLLPLYLLVAVRATRFAPALAVGALATIAVGYYVGVREVIYLPMFALGVLLAVSLPRVEAATARFRPWMWGVFGLSAWALVTSVWWAPGPTSALTAVSSLGATMIVVLMIGSPLARRAGDSGVGSWLGKRSFSLYLVHEPILVTLGFALPGISVPVALALGLPTSLIVAHLFFVAVERPSHRLARLVGRRMAPPLPQGRDGAVSAH